MAFDIRAILAAVESHALAVGGFDRVLKFDPRQSPSFEPQNMPGYGLTCAVWPETILPHPGTSGLNVSSVRLTLKVRLYRARTSDPLDLIDPEMVEAVNRLWTAYHGDFTLGGLIMNVDLLGQSGPGISARAGYLEEDEQVYRIYDIDLPLIIADVFAQSA